MLDIPSEIQAVLDIKTSTRKTETIKYKLLTIILNRLGFRWEYFS